jgi:hypothetical protein
MEHSSSAASDDSQPHVPSPPRAVKKPSMRDPFGQQGLGGMGENMPGSTWNSGIFQDVVIHDDQEVSVIEFTKLM